MPNDANQEFARMSSIQYHNEIEKVIREAYIQQENGPSVEDFILDLVAYRELQKERQAKAIATARQKLATIEEVHTSILTLSLDKKTDKRETVKKIKEIIDFVSTLSYLEEPILSCEFFSECGWNPHVHIFSYNSTKRSAGVIAQQLRRQIANRQSLKDIVYRVQCKRGRASNQANYLVSLKKESKREHQIKDEVFRKENEIMDYYLL